MSQQQFVLLGTGTCELNPKRNASAALFRLRDGLNVAFDFGRGTPLALARRGIRQDQLQHIVISHFHPDHSSALPEYLQAACWSKDDPRSTPLNIYGPRGIVGLIDRFRALYGASEFHKPGSFEVNVHPVSGPTLKIDGYTFEYVYLPRHKNHGIGLSVNGRRYVHTADGYYSQNLVRFINGAEVAVVDYGHQNAAQILKLALRAKPKILVLSHISREPPIRMIRAAARAGGYQGSIQIGRDGRTFNMGS